jgi:hypothetical protein
LVLIPFIVLLFSFTFWIYTLALFSNSSAFFKCKNGFMVFSKFEFVLEISIANFNFINLMINFFCPVLL